VPPQLWLSLSELKNGRTDGAIRRELGSREGAQRPEQRAVRVNPCLGCMQGCDPSRVHSQTPRKFKT
jgi:hypothetical protein